LAREEGLEGRIFLKANLLRTGLKNFNSPKNTFLRILDGDGSKLHYPVWVGGFLFLHGKIGSR